MNDTTQLLQRAAEMEKKAYTEYVTSFTSSGIMGLVQGGVDFDKASGIVKEACDSNSTLAGIKANIEAFEKTAEYIQELESKIEDLEKAAALAPVLEKEKAEKIGPMSKLASAGFSEEEINMISQLPENLMTKVANVGSQPWDMGGATGIPREKTDPMLEFLLG